LELQASPEFKGIKTLTVSHASTLTRFKPALNSKGLRPSSLMVFIASSLQASPEFKGIKTSQPGRTPCVECPLQASPEFKGIKTPALAGF